MTVTAASLRELHRIQRQVSDLNDRLARGPNQVAAGQAHCRQLEESLEQLKAALTEIRKSADGKQLQLREREARIEDLKGKLNACSSNREYQTLKDQISADLQANSVLEDEILDALEQIDEQEGAVGSAAGLLQQGQNDLAKLEQRVAGEKGQLESELTRVTAALESAEAGLPPDFRAEYRRISAARGEHALATVEDEICTSCFQRLTAQTMNELFLERPTFCKSCGSVLYLPEDTRVQ